MASSFNAYGNEKKQYGGHTPVWLGTVAPHAVGGVLAPSACVAGAIIKAGTPVNLVNGVITPAANAEAAFNGYLYNDIKIGEGENLQATGAVVMFHGEGLLVDFTPAAGWDDSVLKRNVPGVAIVRLNHELPQ